MLSSKNGYERSIVRRPKGMCLTLIACLLAPMLCSAGGLSVESGLVQLVKSDVDGVQEVGIGEQVTLPVVIRSGAERAVVRLDEATFIALEPGSAFEAYGLDDTLRIAPQSGMIVVHAHRIGVDSPGVQVEYRDSSFLVHDGTLGLMIGDDGILMRLLLGGQGFEMSGDGVFLTERGAPSMFMVSEAAALEITELGEVIRSDQIRLNSVAVSCATLLAERLEAEQDGLRSTELGAVLESMRLVRFRMNREESSRVRTILVNAARREWALHADRKAESPELITIPKAVAPWDQAIRTWMR